MTRIIAHRGDRAHAPENTLRAFELARQARCDCIELDLQLSFDGEVMVFHDERLERLTGARGRVRDHSARDLNALHISPRQHPPGPDSRLCRLREVLDWAGTEFPLYLELKVPPGDPDEGRRLLDATLECVGSSAPHILASFDPRVVEGALEAGRAGVLIARSAAALDALHPSYVSSLQSLSLHFGKIDEPLMTRLRQLSVAVWAWTVNRRREFRRLQGLGVEAICTDDPAAALQWREKPA